MVCRRCATDVEFASRSGSHKDRCLLGRGRKRACQPIRYHVSLSNLRTEVQLIRATQQVVRDINSERKVATSVETGLPPIHEDGCFIIHSAEVKQYFVSGPVRRYCERCLKPAVDCIIPLNTYVATSESTVQST